MERQERPFLDELEETRFLEEERKLADRNKGYLAITLFGIGLAVFGYITNEQTFIKIGIAATLGGIALEIYGQAKVSELAEELNKLGTKFQGTLFGLKLK